jgi:hypothetical protein
MADRAAQVHGTGNPLLRGNLVDLLQLMIRHLARIMLTGVQGKGGEDREEKNDRYNQAQTLFHRDSFERNSEFRVSHLDNDHREGIRLLLCLL